MALWVWLAWTTLAAAPLAPFRTMLGDVKDIDMLDLSGIDYEEGKPLPSRIQNLDGQRVRISGYMDVTTQEGAKEFRLASDNCGCNGRKVHHFVKVKLKDKTIGYTPNVVKVTGTLAVGEEKEDGYVTSLYRMEAESVE
ncbi:MAG: hypothetical protein U1E76_01030 [Planctomycetota bacterium]